MDPKTPETYWSATVRTVMPDGKDGCTSICGGKGGDNSLEGALAGGVNMASYYVVELGYTATVEMTEHCALCHNLGVVPKAKSKFLTKRCPACKGKRPIGGIPPFPVRLHQKGN